MFFFSENDLTKYVGTWSQLQKLGRPCRKIEQGAREVK